MAKDENTAAGQKRIYSSCSGTCPASSARSVYRNTLHYCSFCLAYTCSEGQVCVVVGVLDQIQTLAFSVLTTPSMTYFYASTY